MDQRSIDRLRQIANARTPTPLGNLRRLTVDELVTRAREICDDMKLDYSGEAVHGHSFSRPKKPRRPKRKDPVLPAHLFGGK